MRPRIAIVLTSTYGGAVLRQAKLIARVLWLESRAAGEDAAVVVAYPGGAGGAWESDWPESIASRAIEWQTLDADTAARAMLYNGAPDWKASAAFYSVAEDWMRQLCDCDFWLLIGDGLTAPLLPLRPYAVALYEAPRAPMLDTIRGARKVIGPSSPLVVPLSRPQTPEGGRPYFYCPCGFDRAAVAALLRDDGDLGCVVAGAPMANVPATVRFSGEVSDVEHARILAGASFVWLPREADGAGIVAGEAAAFGIPTRIGDLRQNDTGVPAGPASGDCWRIVRECL